jgi:UDPglucose 6-dehydrogenase
MQNNSDNFKQINLPVFFGLSHLGQVFSLCWSKKVGNCYVFDSNKKALNSFKERSYTLEEPKLNKLKLNKIKFLKKFEEIKKFKYIFFTHDTPLNIKNGKPELNFIHKNLKKILSLKFQAKTYLIISSQINPELIKNIKKDLTIDKNIKIFYLVDTLKMGESLDKFLNPNQIIIGGEKKEKKNMFKLFKKFKSKKFYISLEEAIITKMAINIYLSFSVTFANIIDDLCRQYGSNYSKIIKPLKNDNRIGHSAYINPSLGFSGGHLERDLFYLNEISKNIIIKKTIKNVLSFNDKVINKINDNNLFNKKKIIKTLVVGKSYKKNSFSIVNSTFDKLNKKFKLIYFDDIFFDYNDLNKKLNELVKKNDLIIYNYSSRKTLGKILELSKKFSKQIINVSEKKINFKNNQNFINLFNNY